jgi:hypothetical protein
LSEYDKRSAARVGVLATAASVLSAFFGVQSSKVRERDFSRGSPLLFIALGGALTLGFVVVLASVVRLVIGSTAGG